mgnify:CR=1 FL=1
MLSASITGAIITRYEDAFSAIPLLVSFIPMLMDTGGNCGSQSSTLIIRGLALNEIRFRDIFQSHLQRIPDCTDRQYRPRLCKWTSDFPCLPRHETCCCHRLSLIATVILSKLIGCVLPLAAKKVHLDPAIMAAPLITTLVDTCSIIIYFSIATQVFHLN